MSPETLNHLAQTWNLSHAVFVACALPGEDLLRRELAVEGYLVKPLSTDNLWDVLRQFGVGNHAAVVVQRDRLWRRLRGEQRQLMQQGGFSSHAWVHHEAGTALCTGRRRMTLATALVIQDIP